MPLVLVSKVLVMVSTSDASSWCATVISLAILGLTIEHVVISGNDVVNEIDVVLVLVGICCICAIVVTMATFDHRNQDFSWGGVPDVFMNVFRFLNAILEVLVATRYVLIDDVRHVY